MSIVYTDIDDFYIGIKQLVIKGLTFQADATNLTIRLLGGF